MASITYLMDLSPYQWTYFPVSMDVFYREGGLFTSEYPFGKLPEGLIFITVFAVFRRILGGYHAKSHSSCILTFSIFVLLTMILLFLFDAGVFITITLLFIAVSGILIIRTINRLNKGLISIKKINKLDVIIITCICSLNIFASVYGTNQIGFTVSLSIFTVFVSLLIQSIEDRKGGDDS